MEELEELFDIRKLIKAAAVKDNAEQKNLQERFRVIAKDLFNNYYIKKGKDRYEFAEIEFYLYCENYKDLITYPRYARAGDWYFHSSGVDICFGPSNFKLESEEKDISKPLQSSEESKQSKEPEQSKEKIQFGGILIRSLVKIKDNKRHTITGPMNCCNELFDRFSAFYDPKNPNFEYPYLSEKKKAVTIAFCKRYINIQKKSGSNNKYEDKLKSIYKYGWDINDENTILELIKKNVTEFENFIENKNYRFYNPKAFENLDKYYPANPLRESDKK